LTVRQHKDGMYFEVGDSGQGMSAEAVKTIFDPFRQAEEGVRKGGSGLGLSISHRYVALMGGKLEVDSSLGQGTRFHFTVKFLACETGRNIISDQDWGETYNLEGGKSLYALVVDDVLDNRLVLSQILENAGIETDTAENGRVALEKIHQRKPDVVWMDLRMPVMTGDEAIELIRNEYGEALVVIAISASDLASDKETYTQRGFDDYVPKPFRLDEVFKQMEAHLGVRFTRGKRDQQINLGDDESLELSVPSSCYTILKSSAENHMLTKLKKEIVRMEQASAGERHLAIQLGKLVQRYDMDGILKMLEEVEHD